MTLLGYNVHANAQYFDVGILIAHVERMKEPPPWMLFQNNLGAAIQYHNRFPQTQIIYRAWPDDSAPREHGYQEWLNDRIAGVGDNDFWIKLNNESGFSDETLNWTTNIITLNSKPGYGRKLLIGSFSAGTPEYIDILRPAAKRMLQAADTYRDKTVLDLHEYAAGHMMSSYTTNPHRAEWPDPLTEDMNLYHVGRYRFLVRACKEMNIALPRLGISEFGMDDMSDIKPWLNTLKRTAPYRNIKGWRTLVEQWREWEPGVEAEEKYFVDSTYAERVIYPHPAIEFILHFCMWDSGGWGDFRLDNAPLFLSLREKHMTTTPVEPAPKPPFPAPGRYIVESTKDGMNVRSDAGETNKVLVTLQQGARLTVLPPKEPRVVGKYEWFHCQGVALVNVKDGNEPPNTKFVGFDGWAAATNSTKLKPDLETTPCPDPEPAPPLLTAEEQSIMDTLATALDKFKALEQYRAYDWTEFQQLVHAAQDKVLVRPVVRSQNAQP